MGCVIAFLLSFFLAKKEKKQRKSATFGKLLRSQKKLSCVFW
jgi:hypothetical protein